MRLLVAIALLFGTRLPAADQSMIYGVVEDATGQALAGADVRIQGEFTGARWKLTSDNEGRYSVAALPAGEYKITVRFPGFRTVSKVGAALQAGQ